MTITQIIFPYLLYCLMIFKWNSSYFARLSFRSELNCAFGVCMWDVGKLSGYSFDIFDGKSVIISVFSLFVFFVGGVRFFGFYREGSEGTALRVVLDLNMTITKGESPGLCSQL